MTLSFHSLHCLVAGAAIEPHSPCVSPGGARIYVWTAFVTILTVIVTYFEGNPYHSMTVHQGGIHRLSDNILPRIPQFWYPHFPQKLIIFSPIQSTPCKNLQVWYENYQCHWRCHSLEQHLTFSWGDQWRQGVAETVEDSHSPPKSLVQLSDGCDWVLLSQYLYILMTGIVKCGCNLEQLVFYQSSSYNARGGWRFPSACTVASNISLIYGRIYS